MPSSWTHAIGATAVAAVLVPNRPPPRVWLALAGCAVLPDLDALGRPFGLGDLAFLGGHRAFTHSVTFAAVLGLGAAGLLAREGDTIGFRCRLWLALGFGIASHGVLDALTSYGEGVAFWAPWSGARYRAPTVVFTPSFGRDLIAFGVGFLAARWVLRLRGIPLPRFLEPERRTSN